MSHLGAAVAEMRCGTALGVARFVQVNCKFQTVQLHILEKKIAKEDRERHLKRK